MAGYFEIKRFYIDYNLPPTYFVQTNFYINYKYNGET